MNEGGGDVLQGASACKTAVLGAPQPKRAPGRTPITGLCESADGNLPCAPDTINEALWLSPERMALVQGEGHPLFSLQCWVLKRRRHRDPYL